MKPITVSASAKTRNDGLRITAVLRELDETGELLLHEAKKGMGWTVTGYVCLSVEDVRKLRNRFNDMGVLASVRDVDRPQGNGVD
jgi:hypothetical protein